MDHVRTDSSSAPSLKKHFANQAIDAVVVLFMPTLHFVLTVLYVLISDPCIFSYEVCFNRSEPCTSLALIPKAAPYVYFSCSSFFVFTDYSCEAKVSPSRGFEHGPKMCLL